jgi:glycosyltransferase involved in cell wall biosynthesis
VPGLAQMGIDLEIVYLLGDDYLRERFSGRSIPYSAIVNSGLARFVDLSHQNNYDMLILYCELFPLLPSWAERLLIRKPYIYDFDDAFYLKYRAGRMATLSPILGRKFDRIMAGASVVTAGNKVLAKYAMSHNPETAFLPTVLDTKRYIPQPEKRGTEIFTVGWIGSPSTAPYLSELVAPLSTIGQQGLVKFIVIGGKAPIIPNVTVIEVEWNEDTEVDIINSFDVGLMPLPNDEWARGKCAFKLIQYMACALPVIGSPVGANLEVIRHDWGLLATSACEWVNALITLRDDPVRRKTMGQEGRKQVIQQYSLQKNLPVLANIIRKIVD